MHTLRHFIRSEAKQKIASETNLANELLQTGISMTQLNYRHFVECVSSELHWWCSEVRTRNALFQVSIALTVIGYSLFASCLLAKLTTTIATYRHKSHVCVYSQSPFRR